MRLKFLLVVFVLFFIEKGNGQTLNKKAFKGRVIAEGSDVTGVTIQNMTTQRATITDFDGNFSIEVSLNDTLVFSAVQFKRKVLPINLAIMQSSFVTVVLEEFVNELREVVVNPYNLSGRLDSDLNRLQLEKDVSAEALGLPNANVKILTQSERKLQEASKMQITSGGGFGGAGAALSLNPILNAITGRTKMLKNRVKVDRTYARTQRVQEFYVDSIIEADLKIPKEKINDFMYFCEVDTNFQAMVDTHDRLKIWEFMVVKSKAYRENNGLD